MMLTEKYVREAGIVAAGVGRSLAEAREAKFVETRNGRLALISLSSTFPTTPGREIAGRHPGAAGAESPAAPHHLRGDRGTARRGARHHARPRDEPAGGQRQPHLPPPALRTGGHPGIRTEPHPEDMAEIAMIVRNASRQADYVMVTIHAHEGAGSRFVPAEFLVTFARAMVDAGASVFVGHGPHVLRAIEIYRGAPILYSLGDFLFQNETLQRLPYENYARLGLSEADGSPTSTTPATGTTPPDSRPSPRSGRRSSRFPSGAGPSLQS